MLKQIPNRFRDLGRRAVRSFEQMIASVKEGNDDEAHIELRAKASRRAARVRKEVQKWRRSCGMTTATSHIAHHRAAAMSAEVRRLEALLTQTKERAEQAENRLRLAEIENQELLDILEAERARVEAESDDEGESRAPVKEEEEEEWEGFEDEGDGGVKTAAEATDDEFGPSSPIGRLAVATARRQRSLRSHWSKT